MLSVAAHFYLQDSIVFDGGDAKEPQPNGTPNARYYLLPEGVIKHTTLLQETGIDDGESAMAYVYYTVGKCMLPLHVVALLYACYVSRLLCWAHIPCGRVASPTGMHLMYMPTVLGCIHE